MARIETYNFDTAITPNDYVIGTDGDNLNATRNYKVLTFLDYLGRMYNLNSTDLLFNHIPTSPSLVVEGSITTNNYLDVVKLMSDVTNIYVSKITAFGQLVDEILTTLGTEGLSIMFTDMGDRNNLGIFTVVSAVDFDANTINLTVTGQTTVGTLEENKVMGIRINVSGGVGSTITIAENQIAVGNATGDNVEGDSSFTWTGDKLRVVASTLAPSGEPLAYFQTGDAAGEGLYNCIQVKQNGVEGTAGVVLSSSTVDWGLVSRGNLRNGSFVLYKNATSSLFNGNIALEVDKDNFELKTPNLTIAAIDAALTAKTLVTKEWVEDKIPAAPNLSNYVTLNTVQTISGVKTFSDRTSVSSFNMLPSGGGVLSGRHALYINTSNQLAWLGLSSTKGVLLDQSLITSGNPVVKFQSTGGTIAHLSDIPTDYVTTDTTQTITGFKTFSGGIVIDDSLAFIKKTGNIVNASQGLVYFKTDNTFNVSVGTGVGAHNATFSGIDSFTSSRTFTLPDANGTIALTPTTTAFTPDIIDTTAGATYSHATATGEYVRVGDLVTFSIAITNITTTGIGTGELRITGLPLSPTRTSSALVELSGFIGVNFYQLQARVTTVGNIDFRYQAALDDGMSTLPAATIDAGTSIYISGSIIV